MDEHLRAKPDSLTALMRAGRLDPERVALAAYLGDPRALATGVEPWEPASPQPPWSWRAFHLLSSRVLPSRDQVWIACLVAEKAVRERWDDTPGPLEAIRMARLWVQGHASDRDTMAASYAAFRAVGSPRGCSYAAYAASCASYVADLVESKPSDPPLSFCPGSVADAANFAASTPRRLTDRMEQAWQARAIAEVLLDPLLPWREDAPAASP